MNNHTLEKRFRWLVVAILIGLLVGCTPAALQEVTPTLPATAEQEMTAAPSETPVETLPPSPTPPDAGPMLPVPTPLPPAANAQATPLPTISAIERIRTESVLRVGVLYNTPPLSSLNERGNVVGYEADLAQGIAEALGVEVRFVQVTRQTAIPLLMAGEVDILMASVVHRRESEATLAFSQTYFPGGQTFLLREDSGAQAVADLNGQTVGVVQGTTSERALGSALSDGRTSVTPRLYLTLDQAVGGLGSGDVAAVLSDRVQLLRVDAQIEGVRILGEMLEPEPYAIAFRRHDNALGYLLDRALQSVEASGRLAEIREVWFAGLEFSPLPVWGGLEDDTHTLAGMDAAMNYPQSSILARIQTGQPIRVAGLSLDPEAEPFIIRLEGFYQGLMQEFATRWNVPLEFIPNSAANALELVAGGQAEIAIGAAPTWAGPYEVAYSAPIALHGDRLMVPFNSAFEDFEDLRGGQWVGVFASEPGAADRVTDLASEARARINVYTILNDEDAVYAMHVDGNVDVVYGDSLRLIPQVEANPELVRLTERWYTQAYTTLAVPRLDPDFRALVDVTLQDMTADGTFARLWESTLAVDEPVAFELWPGERGVFLGIRTSAGNQG